MLQKDEDKVVCLVNLQPHRAVGPHCLGLQRVPEVSVWLGVNWVGNSGSHLEVELRQDSLSGLES